MFLAVNFTFFPIIKCCFPIWEDKKDHIAIVSKLKYSIFSKRFLTSKFIFNIGWEFVSKYKRRTGYGWPWLTVVVEELGFTGIYYTILAC